MASQMLAEIQEQPRVLRRILAEAWPEVRRAARAIGERGIRHVQIAARGSSDNAARYAQYALGARNGLLVGLATPSLYTVYGSPPGLRDTLVVGLSQSGQSPDVAEVVERARAQGSPTIAITNFPDSPLGRAAEHVIELRAGEERSIPATKTYTAQLLVLAMLSAALNDATPEAAGQLAALPEAVEAALGLQPEVEALAAEWRDASALPVIGRGFNFSTAFEVALKLQETAYVAALPFSSADFKHGPLSIVEAGSPALIFAPAGRAQPELLALARDLGEWGARTLVVGDPSVPADVPSARLHTATVLAEWLSPFPMTVIGQRLAWALARAKGLDPDRPRRLRKVTTTY